MGFSLGIDTGGTYTDAVIVDQKTIQILSSAKSLTTPDNLFLGISSAMGECLCRMSQTFSNGDIRLVCLSTTLATNAITEGYGGRVCAVFIGYDRQIWKSQGFMQEMATDDIVWLNGGHDIQGNEVEPLDETTAEKEILARIGKVEAFAVSGYFSTRNPDHEQRIKQLVKRLSNLPVTCSHELTSRLNAVSRAITTTHNARLIPLLQQLISDVRGAMSTWKINAPLMIVKGDGAIVPAELAVEKPIETILSGPAASCVGAAHLVPEKNFWVADMGGTTTDMALLMNGYPAIHPEGAWVSSRRTMVEAADIYTVGIGGDSRITVDSYKNISIGPYRAIPLCHIAEMHPEILKILSKQADDDQINDKAGEFATVWRNQTGNLSLQDAALLSLVKKSPLAFQVLAQDPEKLMTLRRIEQMEKMSLLKRTMFTPTDALNVMGKISVWNKRASYLGARILARRLDMDVEKFCDAVVRGVSRRLAKELFERALDSRINPDQRISEPLNRSLFDIAFKGEEHDELDCRIKLKKPLVAIGAPVTAYMPEVSTVLGTRLIVPDHAAVANAFGAATAGIVQRGRAIIRIMAGGRFFRVHQPDGVTDFSCMADAIIHAKKYMTSYVTRMAQAAGASDVSVEITCDDHSGTLPAGKAQEQFLDIEVNATARGDFNYER